MNTTVAKSSSSRNAKVMGSGLAASEDGVLKEEWNPYLPRPPSMRQITDDVDANAESVAVFQAVRLVDCCSSPVSCFGLGYNLSSLLFAIEYFGRFYHGEGIVRERTPSRCSGACFSKITFEVSRLSLDLPLESTCKDLGPSDFPSASADDPDCSGGFLSGFFTEILSSDGGVNAFLDAKVISNTCFSDPSLPNWDNSFIKMAVAPPTTWRRGCPC